jgi:hypothetical protein
MDFLSELGRGMTMVDVNKTNSIQQWIDGFVDDTLLFTNIIQHTDNTNIIQLCNHLTHDMTIWNELLEASGGKLELSKCFYYVLLGTSTKREMDPPCQLQNKELNK